MPTGLLDHADAEEEHEGPGDGPHQRVHLAGTALDRADEDEGNEAGADAVGDRVGERHQDEGEERRNGDAPVVPVDLADLGDHHETDDHQGRGDCLERHQVDQRGQEHRGDEQQAGHDGGQAGARALADAGAGFDVDLVGGRRGAAADDGAQGVHQQDLVHVRDVAVLVNGAGLVGQAHHGAHGVEEDREQDDEGQQQGSRHAEVLEGAEDVDLAQQGKVGRGPLGQRRDDQRPALRVDVSGGGIEGRADLERQLQGCLPGSPRPRCR